MPQIESDELKLMAQVPQMQEEQDNKVCDFEFHQNSQKQPYSKINVNYLTLIFIVFLALISYQIYSITQETPNYYQQYTQFMKEVEFNRRSHKNKQVHVNPIEKKIELLKEKIENLQKKLIVMNSNNKSPNDNTKKALLHIKNIKQMLKSMLSKIFIEQKLQNSGQSSSNRYKFQIPKYIWIYKQANQSYINSLCQQNIKHYGKISNYIVNIIDQSNYVNYFSNQTNLQLKIALRNLDSINERIPNAKKLKKLLILYNLIYQYGGIMFNGPFAFTEDLQWITNISNNIIKLRGNRGIEPQLIAFYKPQNSNKSHYNIQPFEGIEELDKYTIEIPALQQFFMASVEQSQFLAVFINKIYSLLDNIEFIERDQAQYNLAYPKNIQFSQMIVYSASQITLKQKQKQIDALTLNSYKRFAFDYYGMSLINAYYGPYKLDMIYSNFWPPMVPQIAYHSSYFDLARYRYEDFLQFTGPIKYLCRLNSVDKMEQYLNNSANGKDIEIYEGSLIQKIFYPQKKYSFIIDNPEKSFTDPKNEIWTTIPKIIWIYWSDGIENASIFHQMCYNNIKNTASKTRFQVIQLNSNNLKKYIPQQQLDEIQHIFNNAKTHIRIQSISDAYRLAILYRHGGIYFDITSVGLQNFDWILDIGRVPSQFIFNRFGKTPKILISWHPYDGQPGTWQNQKINDHLSIKSQWHLALQNSWIAAEKQSEFIKEWKDLFLQFIQSPYNKIQSILVQNQVNQTRWTLPDNHYLLAMDTAKCVLGRRQKILAKQANNRWRNSAEYYHIWSFNSYFGPTKLRSNLNYDDPGQKINAYLFQYPFDYVKQIIGEPRFYIKLFGYEVQEIIKFLQNHYASNLTTYIHSKSFFKKYLWDDKFIPMISRKQKQLIEFK